MLSHAPRQVSVSLILCVRHSNHKNMKPVMPMCMGRERPANARLGRPADDRKGDRLFGSAKVARLASADRYAIASRPSSGCDAQPSLIAYGRQMKSAPTAAVYSPHATSNAVHFGRDTTSRMEPAGNPNQKPNQSPNQAMEPTPVNVTVPASAGTAPFTSVAHLRR